jgi:hypothetical protein
MKLSFASFTGFSLLLSFAAVAKDPIATGLEVPANLHFKLMIG